MSDQDRISPNNIHTISIRQVMKIKKISIRELEIDPIPEILQTKIARTLLKTVKRITDEIQGVKGLSYNELYEETMNFVIMDYHFFMLIFLNYHQFRVSIM